MRMIEGAIAVLMGASLSASAQDHASCPHATLHEHRADVDRRHDHATGVPHEAAEHHFLLARDGGAIRLEVKDASQGAERDRIRGHLQVVARSFAAGNFTLPRQIHDQVPPGVPVMKERRAVIRYAYAPTDRGGVVTISTKDPTALAAVHEFLRFQIADHGTGDPTE
jgi:hypothetical protein